LMNNMNFNGFYYGSCSRCLVEKNHKVVQLVIKANRLRRCFIYATSLILFISYQELLDFIMPVRF